MKIFSVFLAIGGFVIFLTLLVTSLASAQVVDTSWTQPFQLSSDTGQVGDQEIVADQFGYVHLFWPERGVLEGRSVLMYSQFDGETWSTPVDVYFTPYNEAIGYISATTDIEGTLHLLFTHRNSMDVYYTKVPINDASSARSWQNLIQLDIPMQSAIIGVDSMGILHVLYSSLDENEPGVYYTSSYDEGSTWSGPVWLDPDIPIGLLPAGIRMEIGDGDNLHAAWYYTDQDLLGRWLRYAHSFDRGQHWSIPYTIDQVEVGSDELRMPLPSLAVEGETIQIIWAGDQQTHRKYRVSYDSGITWKQPVNIFSDLLGQAMGDGIAVDALGRLHFLGQLRYPQGIYHAYWDNESWSLPSMIYQITQDSLSDIGDRIHAHRVRVAIRAGNQLVVTFTSAPSDPQSILYVMQTTLHDVPTLVSLSVPTQTPTATPDMGLSPVFPTSLPEITKMPDFNASEGLAPPGSFSPSSGLVWGIVPVVLLLAGFIIIRMLLKKYI